MERKETINFLHEKLKKYGANVYNYRGQEFIAIANPHSENHMAITFGEEEFAMELVKLLTNEETYNSIKKGSIQC